MFPEGLKVCNVSVVCGGGLLRVCCVRITPLSQTLINLITNLPNSSSCILLFFPPFHLLPSPSTLSVLHPSSVSSCFASTDPLGLISLPLSVLADLLHVSLQQMVLCLHWATSPSNPVSGSLSLCLCVKWSDGGAMHCLGPPCSPLLHLFG